MRDIELRESMAKRGTTPDLAIVVDVVDAFFHCAKCVIRSGLWESDEWAETLGLSTMAQVLTTHSTPSTPVAQLEEELAESLVKNLY